MTPFIIPIVSLIVSFILTPYLPLQMATHWGMLGTADGFSTKTFGQYFIPLLSIGLLLIFKILPKVDPYKKNFSQFKKYYDQFVIIISLFFAYIHTLILVWNLSYHFNMVQYLSPALGILFYYAGILSQNTKPNWFVGIRTPWTLSNKKVWQETHLVGGRLFKAVGLCAGLGAIFPGFSLYLLLAPIIFTVLFVFIYSYVLYLRYN